uniref:Malic enzyme NAD-binding domain-containing protein n=1 Tax=Timema poppense TaxID=170557 RepID=A0A7R9CKE7_TIMPO|nr:unnamed protein product [Timema poppensis]
MCLGVSVHRLPPSGSEWYWQQNIVLAGKVVSIVEILVVGTVCTCGLLASLYSRDTGCRNSAQGTVLRVRLSNSCTCGLLASLYSRDTGCRNSAQDIRYYMFFLCQALADMVTEEDLEQGRIYPPLEKSRQVSLVIATAISQYAYDKGAIPGVVQWLARSLFITGHLS